MEYPMVVNSSGGIIDMSPLKNPLCDLASILKFSILTYNLFKKQLIIHMNVWGLNPQKDHNQTYLIEDFTIKANTSWIIYDFIDYSIKVVISIEDLTFKSHIMDTIFQIANINNFIGFLDNNNG
jgi:hypothetical protein